MSIHHGISCDLCRKVNFSDRRYKCLVCHDFDLCAACYDNKSNVSTQTHAMHHPMQLIVPADDYERVYFGHKRTLQSPMSLTCSLCDQKGLSLDDLIKHTNEQHSTSISSVLCPICFTRQKHLAVHLRQHTQENMTIKSKPAKLIGPFHPEDNESKPFIASRDAPLVTKLIDQHSNTNEDDRKNRFIHALLTDLLGRGSLS